MHIGGGLLRQRAGVTTVHLAEILANRPVSMKRQLSRPSFWRDQKVDNVSSQCRFSTPFTAYHNITRKVLPAHHLYSLSLAVNFGIKWAEI